MKHVQSIYGSPRFNILLSRSLIDQLILLAKAHYDTHCKSQATGMLLSWWHYYDPELHTSEPTTVHATFSDLDTCLKICEGVRFHTHSSEIKQDEISAFVADVQSALARSNEIVLSNMWREER